MKYRAFILAVGLLGISRICLACEPIVPLSHLLSGGLLAAGSLAMLGIAVAVKAMVFALVERRLPWCAAVLSMILANVLSSLIGVLLVMGAAVPTLFIVILPAVYAVSLLPARRLVALRPWAFLGATSPRLLAGGAVLLYLASFLLFAAAQEAASSHGSSLAYWTLKFSYVYAALMVSIGLSTLWEEWAVSGLARLPPPKPSLLRGVLVANLVTLGLLMIYAALRMLPVRLRTPGFLVELLGRFVDGQMTPI